MDTKQHQILPSQYIKKLRLRRELANLSENESKQAIADVQALNKQWIMRFFSNNDWLLKKAGLAVISQVKELRSKHNIVISEAGISRFKHGKTTNCNLTYLQIFCFYWSIPLDVMLVRDFKAEELVYGSVEDFTSAWPVKWPAPMKAK